MCENESYRSVCALDKRNIIIGNVTYVTKDNLCLREGASAFSFVVAAASSQFKEEKKRHSETKIDHMNKDGNKRRQWQSNNSSYKG